MPKSTKRKKSPSDVNPLVEYLVDESVREGGVPDRPTREQISLLMAETGRKTGKKGGERRGETTNTKERKPALSKAAKGSRKRAKKPSRKN